jgi:hypothetical protein
MSLQDLVLSGALEREELTTGEVPRFQAAIAERLSDANIKANSNRTRLELAYHTILDCALLALRVDGYRVKAMPGHHRTSLDTLAETLGTSDKDIDYFHELARTRGAGLYEAMPISDSDVRDAIEAATQLAERLAAWVEFRLKGN